MAEAAARVQTANGWAGRGWAGAEAVARVQTANGWAGRGGARALGCGGCGAQWRAATEAGCGHHRNSPWELPPQNRMQFPHARFHRRLKTLELQRLYFNTRKVDMGIACDIVGKLRDGATPRIQAASPTRNDYPHKKLCMRPNAAMHQLESIAPVRGHYTS